MKKTVIFLSVAAVTPAFAQHPANHTVSWYEQNKSVMYNVLALCANDPGDAKHNPDCVNALAASFATSPWIGPDDPRFWLKYPDQLVWELASCHPPVGRSCAAALAASRQINEAKTKSVP